MWSLRKYTRTNFEQILFPLKAIPSWQRLRKFCHYLKKKKKKRISSPFPKKFENANTNSQTYFHAKEENKEANIELSGARWSLQKEISKRISRAGGESTMESWIQIEMSVDRTRTGVDVERVRRRVNKYGAKKRGSCSSWPLSLSSETKMISRNDVQVQSRLLHSYQPDIKCIVYFNLPRRGSVAFMYKRVHEPRVAAKNVVASRRIIEGKKRSNWITINCLHLSDR